MTPNKIDSILPWDQSASETYVPPTEVYAVAHDTYDQMEWDMLKGVSKNIAAAATDVEEKFDTPAAGTAFEDLFNLLYKTDPQINDSSVMAADFTQNQPLAERLKATDALAELRQHTQLDEFASGFALLSMKQQFEEAYEQILQAQQQLQDAQQQAQDAANGQGDPQAAQDALAAAQEAAQSAAQDAAQQITGAMQEATEKLDNREDAQAGFGYGPGELQQMPFDERLALAKRLDEDKMYQVAKLIGQFRPISTAERRKKVKHVPAETYDYDLSNDLTRLVPTELNAMVIPELEDQFWIRWSEHSLLTKRVHGEENAGQGPIIVICDESSSMGGELAGATREMWSKAVTLVLADTARKEGRDFTYIGFASGGQVWHTHHPKGRITLQDTVKLVTHFYGGGTSPEPAMERALERIEGAHKSGRDKPDVLFITDGDCSLSSQFLQHWSDTLRKADAQCYGIQVGGGNQSALTRIADRVLNVTNLASATETATVLFGI